MQLGLTYYNDAFVHLTSKPASSIETIPVFSDSVNRTPPHSDYPVGLTRRFRLCIAQKGTLKTSFSPFDVGAATGRPGSNWFEIGNGP